MHQKQEKTIRQLFEDGHITEDTYYIAYGTYTERIRILDLIANAKNEQFSKQELRDLIKETDK